MSYRAIQPAQNHSGTEHNDAADWNESLVEHEPVDDLEPLPRDERRILQHEIIAGFVALLFDAHNVRLRLVAVAHAFALPTTMGKSIRWWAKELAVTPAALDKEIVRLREAYELPALGGAKSEQSREKLSKAHRHRS